MFISIQEDTTRQRARTKGGSTGRRDRPKGTLLLTVQDLLDTFSQDAPSDLTYREEELLQLYENLLALPDDEPKVTSARVSTEDRDRAVVKAIVSRLSPSPSAPDSSDALSTLLYQRASSTSSHIPTQTQPHGSQPHHVALNLLAPIIQELTAISSAQDVPLALLSMEEWRSLTRVCVRTCHRDLPIDAERERRLSLLMMISAQLTPLLNS